MNMVQQQELIELIDRHALHEGENETALSGVSLFKASTTSDLLPSVYSPCLCFIAQGYKQVMLNKDLYHYGPSQFLAVSVDLPMRNNIVQASREEPYLLLKINIDLQQLSELLIHTDYPVSSNPKTRSGVFVGTTDERLTDSVLRLVRLLDTPDEITALGPQTLREITFRVLRSKHGEPFSYIALKGSNMDRIAKVIHKLKVSFQEAFFVEELAEMVGMSVSSFHTNFKSVTSMSPLQYQKAIRLIEARQLMYTKDIDAMSAAYQVGYESPSQFSREYARMFGNPPGRDITLLKQASSI